MPQSRTVSAGASARPSHTTPTLCAGMPHSSSTVLATDATVAAVLRATGSRWPPVDSSTTCTTPSPPPPPPPPPAAFTRTLDGAAAAPPPRISGVRGSSVQSRLTSAAMPAAASVVCSRTSRGRPSLRRKSRRAPWWLPPYAVFSWTSARSLAKVTFAGFRRKLMCDMCPGFDGFWWCADARGPTKCTVTTTRRCCCCCCCAGGGPCCSSAGRGATAVAAAAAVEEDSAADSPDGATAAACGGGGGAGCFRCCCTLSPAAGGCCFLFAAEACGGRRCWSVAGRAGGGDAASRGRAVTLRPSMLCAVAVSETAELPASKKSEYRAGSQASSGASFVRVGTSFSFSFAMVVAAGIFTFMDCPAGVIRRNSIFSAIGRSTPPPPRA
eukprot:Rhum_TRINITY_DN10067_c0_g1::Rhum_TRINITY_DN10067_c0_g1_i1::g.36618::m.36618